VRFCVRWRKPRGLESELCGCSIRRLGIRSKFVGDLRRPQSPGAGLRASPGPRQKGKPSGLWFRSRWPIRSARLEHFRIQLVTMKGRIQDNITTVVSPQPELTSTSAGKASMPLTAADKTRANMGEVWAKEGARAMRFFAAALFSWARSSGKEFNSGGKKPCARTTIRHAYTESGMLNV
jgi:hypothetical protein